MRSTLLVLCAALTCTPLVHAQSLGQAAAAEAARRKAIQAPARVITADDIKPADPVSNPTEVPPFPESSTSTDPAGRRLVVAPAKLLGGALPMIPVMAIAGGEVFLEVDVTRDGGVSGVSAFRSTPPFTESMTAAVRGWRFTPLTPAQDAAVPEPGKPIDQTTKRAAASKVLVVGVFRPPSLFMGSNAGEAPKNSATPSAGVPVPSSSPAMPEYPPQALFNGVVLVELSLSPDGSVTAAKVVRGAAPFDALALKSARSMSFRPPRVHGQNAPASVYVAVGFRQPVQ